MVVQSSSRKRFTARRKQTLRPTSWSLHDVGHWKKQAKGPRYRVEMVTPFCVDLPPIEIWSARSAGKTLPGIIVGIVTFSCMTPDTNPGASPANVKLAG